MLGESTSGTCEATHSSPRNRNLRARFQQSLLHCACHRCIDCCFKLIPAIGNFKPGQPLDDLSRVRDRVLSRNDCYYAEHHWSCSRGVGFGDPAKGRTLCPVQLAFVPASRMRLDGKKSNEGLTGIRAGSELLDTTIALGTVVGRRTQFLTVSKESCSNDW